MLPRRTGTPQLALLLSLHLLHDLCAFVKCVGEVAGMVSDVVRLCWPWEDRAVVMRGVCCSHGISCQCQDRRPAAVCQTGFIRQQLLVY